MDYQLRLPSIGNRPDEHTPAIARHSAVHCLQSGLSDPSLRLSRVYASLLAEAIESVWTAVPEMISLEILALTGVETPTVVFHGSRTDVHNTGWMGPNTAETDIIGTDELTAALRSRLPEWYGIEQGTLVLDPVGLAAVPTSRLLYEGNSPPVSAYKSILRSIIQDNHSRNVPTVCQLLLCRSLHTRYQSDPESELLYRVTLRVAELSTAPRPLGRVGLADSVETPRECPIDWETPESITSSRRLADRHWEVETGHNDSRSHNRLYTVDPASTTARWYKGPVPASSAALAAARLRDSTHEYAAMLQGIEGIEPYGSLDVKATLALSSADLSSLLDITPLYGPCSWPARVSRGPPRFIRDRVCSQAAGTAHTEVLADPNSSMTQRGLQAGPSLWEFTRGWLGESGCLSSSHDRRTLGSPHFVGHPNDPDGPVVLFDPVDDCPVGHDVPLVDSAGELIVAANNAVDNDSHLLVVTPTEAIAKQARDILAVPYAAQVGPSTYKLHTVPKAVTTDDGEVIVVEREAPPLSWVVSNGTQRSLHTPERCLSSGPLTEPVAAQRYAAPRMCGIDPPIDMATPDGTVRETLSSRAACMDDYRLVLYPVGPVVPLFCDTVSVVYRDGTDLTEPLSSRDWTALSEESTPEDHIECALERFVEQYTSERLFGRTPGFFGQFRGWYANYSTHALCHVERLGQLLPDRVGVRANMMGDPIGITGRQWWIDTEDLSLSVLHDF